MTASPRAVPGADVSRLVSVAIQMAERAGFVTLEHFGNIRSADAKEDGTPVTVADRTAEELLREEIRSRFPDHGILGEEFGEDAGSVPVRWILDPIDGTRSFMRGVPLYAVLIGIEVEGKPVVGVAHFPALGETVAAASGWGCRWTGVSGGEMPAHVSEVGDLGAACALTTDPATILSTPVGDGWWELCRRAGMVRGWGDAYGHILVATGRAEIMVDPVLSPWDAAALLPILSEAGGSFTDLEGKPTIHGGSGLSTNGRIHAAVLDLLWGRPPEPDAPPGT